MIKVLMSSTTPVAKDGITNVMLNLYKHIDKEKFIVDFITINEPDYGIAKLINNEGGKYKVVERTLRHPLRYVCNYAKLCKGYAIVHVHGNSATMFMEMLAAKIAGVKIRIAHSHNTYCKYKLIDTIFRLPFYALCNMRLACGEEAGKWLFRKRPFVIINNGIECVKYSFNEEIRNRTRNKLGWQNCKIIGHVGNFLPAKNHVYILNIFHKLLVSNPDYRLLLIGEGDMLPEIKKISEEYNMEGKIHFAGSVGNVEEYLSAMDIVIMPSINEGFPLTLIEEQANGLHCIASDSITDQVNLTGNVRFCSLQSGISFWEKIITEELAKEIDRENESLKAVQLIREKNYDINASVRSLQELYLKHVKKCDCSI